MYTFQRIDNGQWQPLKHWYCLATMVDYVNSHPQLAIKYRRAQYHLSRYRAYEFNMQNGTFRHRIIKS